MNAHLLRSLLLPAAVWWLALAAPAQARPVDCSAEGRAGAARCLIATERVQSGRDPLTSSASRSSAVASPPKVEPVSLWSQDGVEAAAPTEPNDDPPLLALLLASVGVIAYMAHRRGGS